MGRIAIAVHGGCGVMAKSESTEEEWAAARADLARSLRAGWGVLAEGGPSIDAVEAAVVVLEDSPHFNAGHGAALNAAGEHELDASIMDGATRTAGGVCAARRIRKPVRAGRAVMEAGDAVLLAGSAADAFAEASGLETVPPGYFTTDRRVDALARMKERARTGTILAARESDRHGTVGAVALDAFGHLAAATSTGGYNNKPVGRVGDSPIVGAGTYARDGLCAVSGTGQGEYFIRFVVGHEIASRVAYLGETVQAASTHVIEHDLTPHGIGAGLIALDPEGRVAAPFNTGGMFRGWITADGDLFVGTHETADFVERLDGPKG